MDPKKFAKGVERLINPIEVGSIHVVQKLNALLPKALQNSIMASSGKKFPQMGFVVEPYSFFLFYEIKDLQRAQDMLPEGFKLIKTHIYKDDEPKYYFIFCAFRAHTSAFWGSRLEVYVIAEDENTGLLSWIILDYDSNTIGYDKKYGLRSPNAEGSVITINHRGTVYVDFDNREDNRTLTFDGDVEAGNMKELDQRLWLEGNLSVGHGKALDGKQDEIFSLKFEPCEMEKALDIPVDSIRIDANTWYPGLFSDTPDVALCFPYSQHFVSDSPGFSSNLRNEEELKMAVKNTDFNKIKVFNTRAMRIAFVVGMILSFFTTASLFALLLF